MIDGHFAAQLGDNFVDTLNTCSTCSRYAAIRLLYLKINLPPAFGEKYKLQMKSVHPLIPDLTYSTREKGLGELGGWATIEDTRSAGFADVFLAAALGVFNWITLQISR